MERPSFRSPHHGHTTPTAPGVDTSYRIDGSTLIQKIDHVGSTYPVVADPNLGWFGVCDFWSSSTHEVESWNRSVQATKGGKFFTLRVVMTCGEAGAGGYGWRHVRNSTYGQDHSAELSAALEKAFGYGINEYSFLDNVSAVIRHGLATPAAGNQVKITRRATFFDVNNPRNCRAAVIIV